MRSAATMCLVPQVIDFVGMEFNQKFAPYIHMANVIVDITRRKGKCFAEDLLPLGFDMQDIAERWHMANAIAKVEQRLMEKSQSEKLISPRAKNCLKSLI